MLIVHSLVQSVIYLHYKYKLIYIIYNKNKSMDSTNTNSKVWDEIKEVYYNDDGHSGTYKIIVHHGIWDNDNGHYFEAFERLDDNTSWGHRD